MIWECWRYISNRELKIKKILQKVIKMIIRASKISIKNINKSLKRMKIFMKSIMIIFSKVSTVKERRI